MKQYFQLIILFIILLSVCTSCKKSSNNSTAPPLDAKTTLLTKATWHKTGEGIDSNRDGNIDIVSAHFVPCNADDLATFFSNGTLDWSEGLTKCNPASLQEILLTWKFTNDGIHMLDIDLKIATLTDTNFDVYYEEGSGWNMMKFEH